MVPLSSKTQNIFAVPNELAYAEADLILFEMPFKALKENIYVILPEQSPPKPVGMLSTANFSVLEHYLMSNTAIRSEILTILRPLNNDCRPSSESGTALILIVLGATLFAVSFKALCMVRNWTLDRMHFVPHMVIFCLILLGTEVLKFIC